jgi:glycosyltransferase involved in cell wall biosynthesis
VAAAASVEDRLHVLEPAAPHQMERLAAQHDLGFVGETGYTHNRRIALTNKQFSYLLAGVPAIMSNVPAHQAFARDADGAVTLYETGDAASLATQLDSILANSERLAAMRVRAFQLGQERFNWQVEQAKLIARVKQTLTGAIPGAER